MKNFKFSKSPTLFVLLAYWLCSIFNLRAAIITSTSAGGSWTSASTWVGNTVPTPNDTVIIASGAIVEVFGNITVRRVVIGEGATIGARLVLLNNTTFNVTGALVVGAPNANGEDNVFEVGTADATVGGLVLNNSAQDNRRAVVRIINGTLRVNGNINYSATGQDVRRRMEITGNGNLIVNGTVSGVATFDFSSTSTVTYNFNGNTTLSSANYGNLIVIGSGRKTIGTVGGTRTIAGDLTLNNGAILSLANNHIVNGNIILNSGRVATNSYTLELGPSANILGSIGSNNHIDLSGRGSLVKRANNVEDLRITYPIGASGTYTPLVIDSLEATLSGGAGSRFIEVQLEGKRSGLAVGLGDALNRTWRMRTVNITAISKLAFYMQYDEADIPNGVAETNLNRVALLATGGWTINPSGSSIDYINNRIKLNSPNTIITGEWTIGTDAAFPPSLPFVYTVQNGNWGSASVWSNNQVPGPSTNIYVHHNIDNLPAAAANNIVITSSGAINIRQNTFTANGTMDVYGALIDHHSGGVNNFRGKFTLHNGGVVNFVGSGNGADMTFFSDVEINGDLNLNGGMIFNRTLNNVIRFRSSQPIVAQRNSIISRVDTLYLEVNHPANPNFTMGGTNNASFIIGDSTVNSNLVVVNKARVALSNATGLDAVPAGNATRKWLQMPNSSLTLTRSNPTGGGVILEATAIGNTVEYAAAANQSILPIDYHHLIISGDRADRVKTIGSGRDVTVAGNLTINDNGAQLQMSNGSNGQKLTVGGNFTILGNGRWVSAPANSGAKNQLTIGGRLIINASSNPALFASVNDSTFTRVILNGSGLIAEGNGRTHFRTLRFASTDTLLWDLSGLHTLDDSITFNAPGFRAVKGNLFISNNAKVFISGTANQVRLNQFTITDRADRSAQVTQRLPITVDSTFTLAITGQAGGAFYDFSGTRLTLNGAFNLGINSNNSALRADSNSTLQIGGAGPMPNNLILRSGFRMLKSLIYNRTSHNLNMGQPLLVYDQLVLQAGAVQPNNHLSLRTGATVVRAKGRLLGNLAGTNIYNVEYIDSLVSGPELTSIPAIGRLTINAKTDDIIVLAASPQVNNNLVYVNGILQPLANNYIRLANNSNVVIRNTTENRLIPVGIGTRRGFFNIKVNSIGSGEYQFTPVFAPHPQRVNAPNYLNKYLTIGGNATNINYDIGLLYDNNEVIGNENDMAASFYNGNSWTTQNGSIDINANIASMTGLTQLGDFTAGTNMGDSVITNVKQATIAKPIMAYPNPANHVIHLAVDANKYASAQAALYNAQGRELQSTMLDHEGYGTIYVKHLPEGLYFIKISGGHTYMHTLPVIIKH